MSPQYSIDCITLLLHNAVRVALEYMQTVFMNGNVAP